MLKKWILTAVCLCALAAPAYGLEAMDALKEPIDRFIVVLKDPQYKDASKKEVQREKIWAIINEVFDFEAVSRLAVGQNWKRFSDEEKKTFIKYFSDLLGTNYIRKIQEGYTNEKVSFLSQEKIADNRAMVKTKIVRQRSDIPVDYAMFLNAGKWRVYDVKVEGVSLVQNYREQFGQILINKPPAYLIDRVKTKAEEVRKGGETDKL
jgi:phospholipid transport system substrate-binding protein